MNDAQPEKAIELEEPKEAQLAIEARCRVVLGVADGLEECVRRWETVRGGGEEVRGGGRR